MTARHKVSSAALELIMRFEGYRRRAARLADGRWTIGYGHTLTAREGAEVSLDDAAALLLYDVRPVADAVNELTYTPLTQNQFDALVAFAFNVGIDNFRRSSVLRRVNEGAMIQAACALEMWRKADFEGERIVVDALVRRRAAEKTLFLTPSDGWIPAPSPILHPRVDYDFGLPKNSTELETSMTGDVAEAHRATPQTASVGVAAVDAIGARLDEIAPEATSTPAVADAELEPADAAVAESPSPEPAYLAAPALISTLFGPAPAAHAEPDAPSEHELTAAPVEPVTEAAEPSAEAAQSSMYDPQPLSPIEPEPLPELHHQPEPEPIADPAFEIPTNETGDLSRRVVWREAPMETEAERLLNGGLSGVAPFLLLLLFLGGLVVFAGGIVLGLNAKGSGVVSWGLGLVGIGCVVSAVYAYLERLGGRED
ncbi:MAG TPA: glycoside hydrolase family protein [Caulobacteraceae bacterium]|nr:glycoside hydrolase family protein [Caulobacteraceae bacterium]